jgi:hypothetical protein
MTKSTEWAFVRKPPHRLTHPTTASNLHLNAFHLVFSTRMVGWKRGTPLAHDLPSRWSHQLAYHVGMLLVHVTALDWNCWFVETLFPESIGSIQGGDILHVGRRVVSSSIDRYITNDPTVAKSLHSHVEGPLSYVFAGLASYFVGYTLYHALCYAYHGAAVLGMIFLREGGEEWPTLMNSPWRATSLLNFWKRWHSVGWASGVCHEATE